MCLTRIGTTDGRSGFEEHSMSFEKLSEHSIEVEMEAEETHCQDKKILWGLGNFQNILLTSDHLLQLGKEINRCQWNYSKETRCGGQNKSSNSNDCTTEGEILRRRFCEVWVILIFFYFELPPFWKFQSYLNYIVSRPNSEYYKLSCNISWICLYFGLVFVYKIRN